jgi:ABC-type multidrug transport system permease subunit
MFTRRDYENTFLFALRWIARALGVLCIVALLLFISGGVLDLSDVSWEELGVVLIFPLGLLSGLILAWEEEVKGGVLVIVSVVAFYLIYDLALGGSLRQGAWILMFGVPGILFLIHGAASSFMRKPSFAEVQRQ